MTIHERLAAFWAGERPDRIPYTIYQWEWKDVADDPAWGPMFDAGLGVTYHVPCWHEVYPAGVERIHEQEQRDGYELFRIRFRTPLGEIFSERLEGSLTKPLLETADDYRILQWIVEHTDTLPCYDDFRATAERIQPYGVPLSFLGRTPLQTILVDFVGLEQFAFQLYDFADEMDALYAAMRRQFRRRVEIAAAGPGTFVAFFENFSAETLGPQRYADYLLPVYEECIPLLHEAGKIAGVHYDGKTVSCASLIAHSPIDLLESLTPPPEGDQTLAEARANWPEKLFWSNINVGQYALPSAELREHIHSLIAQAAVDGARLAFEVSEHLPANWRESMPVVLEALHEAGTINDR